MQYNTIPVLYGDGVHDDAPVIQSMLDSKMPVVYLPQPKVCYLVGATLHIHGGQTLVLPESAVIRQADGVNAPILRNTDGETGVENVTVIGGIWDLNNLGQHGNNAVKRQDTKDESVYVMGADYDDTCCEEGNTRNTFPETLYRSSNSYGLNGMMFENIRGLSLLNITFRDPVIYCVIMCRCSEFHVENITFDFNDGNPLPANMDGIHLEGGCHNGIIRHLRGTVYDDMVALNADELVRGDMYDILIDDLEAKHAHSAVRLLASGHCVHDITISNIRGSYFTYCVGFTKYFKMGNGVYGKFKNISVKDCEFAKSDILPWFRNIDLPLFHFQTETEVDGLLLQNIHRLPSGRMADFFGPEDGAIIKNVTMENVRGDMALDKQNINEFLQKSRG